jgi:hypothetical protein
VINKLFIAFLLYFVCFFNSFSQNNSENIELNEGRISLKKTGIRSDKVNMLAPSKAAFYSAVLPGLGQAYNKKYWKIPIVYGAIGTGVYFYVKNNKLYNRYRDAYKRRLAGYQDDEFYGDNLNDPRITDEGLINAQEHLKEQKELAGIITLGLYALNIIDANVDAHLMQFNVNENLSLAPHYDFNTLERTSTLGISLNLKIN